MTWHRGLIAAAFTAAAISLVPGTPAHAVECPDGIIVVVDPGPLGGSVTARCVTTSPANGVQALRDAGHRVDFVPNQPGFVCQVDRRPDPCNMAPAHAYWSYWYAEKGGTWRYSNIGAGDPSTPRAQVEGWRFGDGSSAPSIPPPDGKPAPGPEPEPEEPKSSEGSGSGGSGSSDSTGSSSGPSGSGNTSPNSDGASSRSGSSSSGSSGSAGTSNGGNGGDSTPSAETDQSAPTEEPGATDPDTDPAEPDRSGLRNQLREAPELPPPPADTNVDDDADDPGDGEDEPDERASGDVELPARDDEGLPTGLIAGGGLLAGLATMTALQVRRRRLDG